MSRYSFSGVKFGTLRISRQGTDIFDVIFDPAVIKRSLFNIIPLILFTPFVLDGSLPYFKYHPQPSFLRLVKLMCLICNQSNNILTKLHC